MREMLVIKYEIHFLTYAKHAHKNILHGKSTSELILLIKIVIKYTINQTIILSRSVLKHTHSSHT